MSDIGTTIATGFLSPNEVYFTNNYSQRVPWQKSSVQPSKHNLAVAISVDGNAWVTVGASGLFKSTNHGVTWDLLNSTYSLFSVSCNIDCSTLYALGETYLYKSTDGGKSLIAVQNYIPSYYGYLPNSVFTSRDATCVVVLQGQDLNNPGSIYLSTDSGVSFSIIPGPNFKPPTEPTPNIPNIPISISGTANCDQLFVSGRYGDIWESYKLVF